MNSKFESPWDFSEASHSDDSKICALYYEDLTEKGEGGPLCGKCFLKFTDNARFEIEGLCGGPAVWNTNGQSLAIPIWYRTFLKGPFQRLAIIDLKELTLTTFNQKFDLIELQSFDGFVVTTVDSPLQNARSVVLDTRKAKALSKTQLRKG